MSSKMIRTKGSQSEVGMMYQYGVSALLASQLSRNDQVADYIIYSSEKSAGKFDDIIARVKLKDEDDWYLFLIQAKYKDTKRLNVSDNLKGKRVEYFLSDYIQSFNDILSDPNLTCRRGIPDDNIKFSIFCNKGIQTPVFIRQDCTFQLNMYRHSETSNVLSPFGNKYWKFACKDLENSQFQNFFNNCCLYLEQPNYSKLNEQIAEACHTKNTKAIINYVKDYFNDDDLYKQGLRKEVFEIHLQTIRLIDDIPPVISFVDLVDDNRIAIWNEITTNHDITIVNYTHNFAGESYLYSCLLQRVNTLLNINVDWKKRKHEKNVLSDEVIEKFLTYSKTKRLRYWLDSPSNLRLLLIELWKCGDLPLILRTHTELGNFEKYTHLKRSYIILDDWTNRSDEINSSKMDIFASLSSISDSELQDRMLEATVVSPQGRKPVTLKNLLRDDEDLMSTFTCKDVLKMMSKRTPFLKDDYYKGTDYLAFIIEDENCSEISDRIEPYDIGHNFRVTCPLGRTDECIEMIRGHADISEHYTIYHLRKIGEKLILTQGDPRRLNHRFVDQYGDSLFISNTGECIPIIGQTIDVNELQYIPRQLRRVTLPRSFFSSQETQICVLSSAQDFIERSVELTNVDDVLNETVSIEKKTYFVKFHETENRQYYWQKLCQLQYPILDIYVRDGRFELLRYKNCKNLSYHISYNGGIYSEQEFFNDIRDEREEIAVVTGDAGIGKSSFVKWLCNNYSTQDYIIFYDLINLQVDQNKSERQRIDLIDFIFNETQKGLPTQYTDFVSNLRRGKKLIWVLDSFDEIRLACEKQVLDLIGVIANSGAQIVLAARVENCNILMDQFEIRLIKVEPLEEEDCRSYWELDEDLLDIVSSELATNPLYLNFLKMISANREELVKINKYTLYEKVINMKVKHCLRATYKVLQDYDIQRAVVLLENLALVALFGKELIEAELCWSCDNEVADMTKFGIVIRFDEDNYPIFYHRTFVEFLFAQWIAKACRINIYKSAAKHLYKQIFDENKLHILNILFEDEELHSAVIYKRIDRINDIVKEDSEYWNSIDRLGRTAIHAAVICCSSSSLLPIAVEVLNDVVTAMLESGFDTEKPDTIMNWNWSEYMRADVFNFICSFENMEIMRIYLRLQRRKIEKHNCLSPLFPTQYFYLLFLRALKFATIDMISDLVLLQNFENKIFYNFYQACLGLLPEGNLKWTEHFRFEGQLTPLHVACIYGSISLIQHLIEINTDIDAPDSYGYTPLCYSIMRCSLLREPKICTRDKDIIAVKLLLEAGANPAQMTLRNHEASPPYLAIQTRNIDVVVMIVKAKTSLIHRSDNKNTLLHLAVNLGCIDIVRFLLHHGVPRYLRNEQNETALDIAIKQNHIEMIDALSEKENVLDAKEVHMRAIYLGQKEVMHAEDSPIHNAVCSGNIELIKLLLRKGEDVNVPNRYGSTPLHIAVSIGRIKVSRILLSKGADILVRDKLGQTPLNIATTVDNIIAIKMILERGDSTNIANLSKETPLHAAVRNNNLYVVKLLLEKGANTNVQNYYGITPLHLAIFSGFEDIVALLLGNGADPHIPTKNNEIPLHTSVSHKHRTITELLLRNGTNVNCRDGRGYTAFLIAVHLEDIDTVRLLLENGANLNDEDMDGCAALTYPLSSGNVELTRLLIEKGADINAKTVIGVSVLSLAAYRAHINIIELLLKANVNIDRQGGTYALSCAICKEDINVVKLLLTRGACVNTCDERYGISPLHLAVAKGNAAIVGLLLENGAHVNANCGEQSTPLHQAVMHKNRNIVKLLIDKGADINAKFGDASTLLSAVKRSDIPMVELLLEANANNTNEDRLVALRHAVIEDNIDIIRLLLNKGVDLNIYDENDYTPLYIATCNKRADIVGLLLENGADVNILSRNGLPPFVKAVLEGHIEIARLLLDNGVNVNRSFADFIPLHFATGKGDLDFVKFLIEKGADVNMRNEDGTTALEIAMRCGYTNILDVLLKGRTDMKVQTLVEEEELRNNGNTEHNEANISIFYWAAINGDLQIIKFSLDLGVNINFQNSNGSTALHVAVMNNKEDIVETLLERGADVNLKTNDGFTPLCLAKLKGHTNIADLLTAFMLSLSTL